MSAGAGDEVDGWDRYRAHEQQMSLEVGGQPADVLGAVEFGLSRARFKIRDRHSGGFRATYQNYLALIPDLAVERTTLVVAADQPGAGLVRVAVRVESGGVHRSGANHASTGLTAAVAALRQHGAEVTFSDWTPVPQD